MIQDGFHTSSITMATSFRASQLRLSNLVCVVVVQLQEALARNVPVDDVRDAAWPGIAARALVASELPPIIASAVPLPSAVTPPPPAAQLPRSSRAGVHQQLETAIASATAHGAITEGELRLVLGLLAFDSQSMATYIRGKAQPTDASTVNRATLVGFPAGAQPGETTVRQVRRERVLRKAKVQRADDKAAAAAVADGSTDAEDVRRAARREHGLREANRRHVHNKQIGITSKALQVPNRRRKRP